MELWTGRIFNSFKFTQWAPPQQALIDYSLGCEETPPPPRPHHTHRSWYIVMSTWDHSSSPISVTSLRGELGQDPSLLAFGSLSLNWRCSYLCCFMGLLCGNLRCWQ